MDISSIYIISLIQASLALVFIGFLMTTHTQRRLPNFLISLYLFFFAIDTLALYVGDLIYPRHPILGMLISQTTILQFPLLYLFIKSSVYKDFEITIRTWLHVIPYIFINMVLVPDYYALHFSGSFNETTFYNGNTYKLLIYFLHSVEIFYFTLIFVLLRKYKQLLYENYSEPDLKNYKWLMTFFVMIVTWSVIATIKNLIGLFSTDANFNIATNIVNISVLLFLYWLLIYALKNPGVFTGIYSNLRLVRSMVTVHDSSTKLDREQDSTRTEALMKHMETQEPFLDASLSVHKLASQLKIPTRDLSILINHKLNKHFYDFINEFRIEKAKNILANKDNIQLTILEILYQVGFNSKSSFNTMFKKSTGMTPTQYRRKHL